MKDLKEIIKQHKRGILDEKDYSKFAVMLPLLQTESGQLQVLFEVRSKNLKGQPGEICFPGGGVEEKDCNKMETAVRETCEELQIYRDTIEVWGSLDVLFTPFQYILYPYVGFIKKKPDEIKPNSDEVQEVFTVPLSKLQNITPEYHEISVRIDPGNNFPYQKIPGGRNYAWSKGRVPEYFYEVQGKVIWGLTARILTNFLLILDFHQTRKQGVSN